MKISIKTVQIVSLSSIAKLLKGPIEPLLEAANNSEYCYGTNKHSLVTKDGFRENILEMILDDDYAGAAQIRKRFDDFNTSTPKNLLIDLET